jgi:hypothetical protein
MPEGRATEGKSTEGEPLSEERAMEGKSTGRKPSPEEGMTEGKPPPKPGAMEGKSVATECEGTGSHEAAAACERGPAEGAAAKGRPSEAATAKAATGKCRSSKTAATKAAATKAAVNGRSAQRRGCRRNRRGGQSDYYIAHQDARTPAFMLQTRQFALSCRCGAGARVIAIEEPRRRKIRAVRAPRQLHARQGDRLLVPRSILLARPRR